MTSLVKPSSAEENTEFADGSTHKDVYALLIDGLLIPGHASMDLWPCPKPIAANETSALATSVLSCTYARPLYVSKKK